MASGALLFVNATSPVQALIEDGKHAVLVNDFDTMKLAKGLSDALAQPERYNAVHEAARRRIVRHRKADLCRTC